MRSIAGLLAEDAITFAQAREVLEAVNGTDKDPERVVDERGMRQVTDTAALEPIVDEVLARCTDQVQQYHDGNKKVVGYLVGQCMKASKGSGNPKLFNKPLYRTARGVGTAARDVSMVVCRARVACARVAGRPLLVRIATLWRPPATKRRRNSDFDANCNITRLPATFFAAGGRVAAAIT